MVNDYAIIVIIQIFAQSMDIFIIQPIAFS